MGSCCHFALLLLLDKMPRNILLHFLCLDGDGGRKAKAGGDGGLDVRQSRQLSRQCRYILEASSTALREFESVCKGAGKTSRALFDPFVKDSRCQTQACMVHDLVMWFRDRPRVLLSLESVTACISKKTTHALDQIDAMLCASPPSSTKEDRAAWREELRSRIVELFSLFKLAEWAKRCVYDAKTTTEADILRRFKLIIVFFLLSCRRGANRDAFPELCASIDQEVLKKKKLDHAVRKFARSNTLAFEREQRACNSEQDSLHTATSDYMSSFITMRNYVERNGVRIVFFFRRNGELHRFTSYRPPRVMASVDTLTRRLKMGAFSSKCKDHADRTRRKVRLGKMASFDVSLEESFSPSSAAESKKGDSDDDLMQTLDDLIEVSGAQGSGKQLTSCAPDLSVADMNELVFGVVVDTKSEDATGVWEWNVECVTVDQLLLSYAYSHVKRGAENPRSDIFRPLIGTSLENQSLGMIVHVFCTTYDMCLTAPKWERRDAKGSILTSCPGPTINSQHTNIDCNTVDVPTSGGGGGDGDDGPCSCIVT